MRRQVVAIVGHLEPCPLGLRSASRRAILERGIVALLRHVPQGPLEAVGRLDHHLADDLAAATGAPAVKDQLRQNTDEAVAAGVYGVPSFVIEDHLFWGDDMFEMLCAWLDDPTLLDNPEARRISDLPPAAERKR